MSSENAVPTTRGLTREDRGELSRLWAKVPQIAKVVIEIRCLPHQQDAEMAMAELIAAALPALPRLLDALDAAEQSSHYWHDLYKGTFDVVGEAIVRHGRLSEVLGRALFAATRPTPPGVDPENAVCRDLSDVIAILREADFSPSDEPDGSAPGAENATEAATGGENDR